MSWKNWQDRFRNHIRTHKLSHDTVGAGMTHAVKQAAVGHWLSGRNKINLVDFFDLCASAGADPAWILFGEDMAALAKSRLDGVLASAAPATRANPNYNQWERGMRKVKPATPGRRRKSKVPKVAAEQRVKRKGGNRPSQPDLGPPPTT